MQLKDYQLYINISHASKQPYFLQTLQFFLPAIEIKAANRLEIRTELARLMEEHKMAPVPEKTPFFLGAVIIDSGGHKYRQDILVNILQQAMQGVVFKDIRWCDGISVIRDRDGDVNDCRIHVAWKVDPPKKTSDQHQLFGAN